jgi:DNA helicase-2/ATP-dependent DNA helicase PcrA
MTKALMSADEILAALDEEQRVVAETTRGPVRVLAGAGTGKTRAITHRIAYGVATGVYTPDKVLALTFTNRASGEMRTRLRHLGAGSVTSQTFHSSALRQVGHFWQQLTGANAPQVLEGKARIIGEVARACGLKADTATLRDLASEIEWRKTSNLSLEKYAVKAHGRIMPAGLSVDDVLRVSDAYEKLKDDRAQIDWEDVLLLCAGMLESERTALMQVRDRYRFFVVDEYQDVSPLQQNLLDLWLGDRQELCVVGDASQTIYSFTGATSTYLLNFTDRFPQAETIELDQSYRSTGAIVSAANTLMRDRAGALELQSTREPGVQPTVTAYPTESAEARGVAASIAEDIVRGAKPEDIAILFRTNAQSAALEQALADVSVSYHVHGSTRFYDRPEVKQAIMALRGASVVNRDAPLFQQVSDVLRELGWTQDAPEAVGAVRAKWESLNAIMALADQAPESTSFRDFTTDLLARQEAKHEPTMHAVTLSSIHTAKGLEWPTVYIIGMCEGLLPISYAKTLDAVAEERRLLYVAMTRAESNLHLSWAGQSGAHSKPQQSSRFLEELGTSIASKSKLTHLSTSL